MSALSIQSLLNAYRDGRETPRGVLERLYGSIETTGLSPVFISLNKLEKALLALAQAEQRAERGPLFGIPFVVKDNIDVAGLPTTAGCPAFSYVPERSAPVVERLVLAGAILVGKTNLDQFATGLSGTRSPYGVVSSALDERYIAGGSSSGSAVAVARGQAAFSLGTDTAGSGRVPAAFNGLVGLKPTRGLVSTQGVVPACRSLDCVSIFSHAVGDAELVLSVCQGFDPDDPYSRREPERPDRAPIRRVGVPTKESLEFFGDAESGKLFAQAAADLAGLGLTRVPVDLGPFRAAGALLYSGPFIAERLHAIGPFLDAHPNDVHPVVKTLLEGARGLTAVDVFAGEHRLAELKRKADQIFQTIDALLVPTAPTHYGIDEMLKDPIRLNTRLGTYTNFVNLLDLSALAVPAGHRDSGLPFGVTLIGQAFHDARLGALGRLFLGEAGAPAGPAPSDGRVLLAVAGAHLSGQPLNRELTDRGARLVTSTRTAPGYRLYALGTDPPKPGLIHAPAETDSSIEVEVWELDERGFGSFTAGVPAPMTIGTTRLGDGTRVKGFSCEGYALAGAEEITRFGGWRGYLASKGR